MNYGPGRYLAKLYGGPYDGHEAEIAFPPRKIVVARDTASAIRIGDYDHNPPPWPARYAVQTYILDRVDERYVGHYRHAPLLTAINTSRTEARA